MKTIWLGLILAGAMALRLGLYTAVFTQPQQAFTPDSQGYYDLSQSLRHGVFSARHGTPAEHPEIFRTPGYPAFVLTGSLAEAWHGVPADGHVRLVIFLQILLDTLLVGLTFCLGKALVGPRAGMLAALFQALSPVAIASCNRLLSDSLYALGLTTAMLLAIRSLREGSWRALIASGVALAAAAYVRPLGLAMMPLFVAAALAQRPRWARAGVLAALLGICVLPWVARNYFQADYLGFSSFAGDSLYANSASETLARAQGLSIEQGREIVKAQEADFLASKPDATPGDLARFHRERAMDIIAQHPAIYARLHLLGAAGALLPGATDILQIMGLTTGERGTIAVLHSQGLTAAVRHYFGDNLSALLLAAPMTLLWAIQIFALTCLGALGIRKAGRLGAAGWLALAVTAASLLLTGPAGHPRYRTAVEPLLSIAAAQGLLMLLAASRRQRPGGATSV